MTIEHFLLFNVYSEAEGHASSAPLIFTISFFAIFYLFFRKYHCIATKTSILFERIFAYIFFKEVAPCYPSKLKGNPLNKCKN